MPHLWPHLFSWSVLGSLQGDLTDPEVLAFHQRAELAAFFYIDAASKIETDHPWEIFYMCGTSTCACVPARAHNKDAW